MYAVDPGAMAAFWRALRDELVTAGIADVPFGLTEPKDLAAHWQDPALLLSQTCGYPFTTTLAGRVRYVATPRFRAPGCVGAFYASAVLVRESDGATGIGDLRDRRVAFNSRDSHSGYNALRALVAPHAAADRFFGAAIETGSHRRSLAALRAGVADVAAVDVVTLALMAAAHPDETETLRSIGHTAAAPGLPFVTACGTSDAELAVLRKALATVCRGDVPVAQPLLLDGIEILPAGSYDAILAQEAAAIALGYPELR